MASRGRSRQGSCRDRSGTNPGLCGEDLQELSEYGEKAQDAARNFQPFVKNSVMEYPMATLAVASLIGFVLGALWKK